MFDHRTKPCVAPFSVRLEMKRDIPIPYRRPRESGGPGHNLLHRPGADRMHDPTGRVYRLTPDGRLTCLVDTIPSPNGIVVDPEETALLVAVTRANQIWRVPLHKSGLVTKVSIFAYLHGGPGGPDGLALDVEGCLLIAHEGFGSVWRLSPYAEPLDRIVSCAARATMNFAFGGPDNARLFITESQTGSILQADLSVALADCPFASRSPLAAPRCFRCFLQRNIS